VDWWEKIKPLRTGTQGKKVPQYLQPIPEIVDSDGTPFPTATKAADGWVKTFAAIEGGTVSSAEQIIEIVLQEAAICLANQYTGPVTDIISRRQVEEALRKTKAGSAPGPDGITVDLLQLMRTWSVVQLSILFTKTALYVQAPIQYKGGSLFPLYKGKGAHIDMDKYRSILLADVIGKVSARAHRLGNLQALTADLSGEFSWQCGGVPGLGTEFPVLAIRMLQEKAKAEGTSIGLIFVDARQAFYAVIRKLVLQVVEPEHAMLSLFDQLRISPTAVEQLRGILAKGPAMEESSFKDTAVRDIASTFTASHFQVRGSEAIGSANKGARPGHPYADIVFSFAFHQVLRALAEDLDTEDLRPTVPTASIEN
jgi:hypothetical protein